MIYPLFPLLEKYFLSSLLIDNSSSPLRHALETSDLGSSISPIMGLEPSNKELVFAVGLEGVLQDKAKDIEKLVMDSLESALRGGISQSKIDYNLITKTFFSFDQNKNSNYIEKYVSRFENQIKI